MNKRLKKHEVLRLLLQCIFFAFQNGYVQGWVSGKIYTGGNKKFCTPGLNCYSCPGALGACPIGSLQAVLSSANYKYSLYVIGFIGAVGVFCGRFICGWICPFGLVQDLLHRIPFPKKRKNLPGHRYLKYLRYVILVLFVIILPMAIANQAGTGQPWFCEYICPSGTLFGGIPLTIANESLRALIGGRFLWKVALLLVIAFLSTFSYRPFCKYVCPLGALYGLANPISVYRYRVDADACVSCGACQKACGMDIRVWEKPNSMDCIRCGRCKTVCPTGAITTTFTFKDLTLKPAGAKTEGTSTEITSTEINNTEINNAEINITETTITEAANTEAANTEAAKAAIIGAETKKGHTVFAALLCTLPGILYPLLCGLSYGAYIRAGVVEEILTFQLYLLSPIVTLIPVIMTLILGIGLFASLGSPERLDRLRAWPLKIMLTLPICLVITYLIITVTAFSYGRITLMNGLTLGFSTMTVSFTVSILLLITMLIVMALIRKKKTKPQNK